MRVLNLFTLLPGRPLLLACLAAAVLLAAVPTSLLCSTDTPLATDVSFYQYADTVHPTPYAYNLLAGLVGTEIWQNGW